jgi:hypothetical protein
MAASSSSSRGMDDIAYQNWALKEFDQPARGLMIAIAKARHQPGY